jgi:hypothetical protein
MLKINDNNPDEPIDDATTGVNAVEQDEVPAIGDPAETTEQSASEDDSE